MPFNANCQCFRDGACMHHVAPRVWFGRQRCVLEYPPADPRLRGCAIQAPHTKPDGYPVGPPSVLRREGSFVEYMAPRNEVAREVVPQQGEPA